MEFVISLTVPICAASYALFLYYQFESQVKREQAIFQNSIDKLIFKTRIAGLVMGVGGSAIFISQSLVGYLGFLVLAVLFSVLVLTRNAKSGISRLARDFEIVE